MKLLYGFGLWIFSALVIGCTDSDENTYTIDRQAYLTQMEGFWLVISILYEMSLH